jgi:hypothetical protein
VVAGRGAVVVSRNHTSRKTLLIARSPERDDPVAGREDRPMSSSPMMSGAPFENRYETGLKTVSKTKSRPGEPDLDWRAGKPAAWIAAHAKRLYRFDSHILTQGWCDPLESGEILGASAHVTDQRRGSRRIPRAKQVAGHGSRIMEIKAL